MKFLFERIITEAIQNELTTWMIEALVDFTKSSEFKLSPWPEPYKTSLDYDYETDIGAMMVRWQIPFSNNIRFDIDLITERNGRWLDVDVVGYVMYFDNDEGMEKGKFSTHDKIPVPYEDTDEIHQVTLKLATMLGTVYHSLEENKFIKHAKELGWL